MLAASLLILSLLVGADWIMDAFLFFSNDTLCEDRNGDGADDFCQYWQSGNLVRLEWDTNFDGAVDVWQVTESGGEVLKMDANFDGKVDFVETRSAEGTAKIQVDADFDGAFDREETLGVEKTETERAESE